MHFKNVDFPDKLIQSARRKKDEPKRILIELDVDENGYEFASTIEEAIQFAETELSNLDETVESVGALRSDCDKMDYILAASSGALCGLVDIFLVGKPGESPIGGNVDKWAKNRVEDFARLCGWPGESSKSPIAFLENKFKVPYDQTGRNIANEIFNLSPNNHHYKSLGHNPTLMGLFFSILDQFTDQSHFVSEGELLALQVVDGKFELRGGNISAKIVSGAGNWIMHLISDVSGSSGSKGRGMGIPSPLVSWANDIVAIRRTLGIPAGDFDRALCDLTLELFEKGFDARFQIAQTIPVLVNELIVRLLYSIRRLLRYYSETNETGRTLQDGWAACEPFSNPTVKRMLTVAHGAFCAFDLTDATVRAFATGAGTFNATEFFLRLNIAGSGRFAISLFGEAHRAIKICDAKKNAEFAEREKTIVHEYLIQLRILAAQYDDRDLLNFTNAFERSDMYIQAFEASARLAELRKVPDDKVLKAKTEIDAYFQGKDK